MSMLEFVHEQPHVRKDGFTARQVRSHVTRRQHRQNRERSRRAIAYLDGVYPNTSSMLGPLDTVQALAQSTGFAGQELRERDTSGLVPADSVLPINEHGDRISQQHFLPLHEDADPEESSKESSKESTPDSWLCPSNGSAKAFSQGQTAYRTTLLQDSENIIGMNLEILRLDLSSVMSLYKSIGRVQSKDFRQQYGLKGTLPEPKFFGFAHTDPTLLSMGVLLGVRNHLDLSGRRLEGTDLVGVVNLENYVVGRINTTLSESTRGVSSQMLATVALCAAYELKHGDPRRFHIHMSGLMHMISLRGGLPAIGAVDPYIRQFLLWMDVNTSRLSGTHRYLQEDGGTRSTGAHPNANPNVFRARHESDCQSDLRSSQT